MTPEKIRAGNDFLRATLLSHSSSRVVATASVAEDPKYPAIIEAIRTFNSFTPDNDPYGEHDFGAVVVDGQRYLWKIDYYDSEFSYGADPYEEPDVCRVLTIMRADEY